VAEQIQWEGIEFLHAEERTNYPLTLSVDDLGVGFALTAQVELSVGAARVCAFMATALEGLVAALERTPERPLRQIDVLPQAERHRVLAEWNATAAAYPQDACVHELFEAQAERTPAAVAVVHDDRELSYAELNAQANRLAHHLRKLGVRPDDRVAICIERSIDLVAAELAILKCGAAYVPLDPAYPAERLSFMIEDCEASLVLTARGAVLPEGLEVHSIDVGDVLRDAGDDSNPGVSRDSGSDAYIMYTSGSTGTPKGVVIPHRAIGRLVINNGYADFNASDRIAFAANPAFDATTMEVWAPLLNGGCIVVIEQEAVLDPLQLSDAFQQQRVTAFFVTTSLFNHYVKVSPQLFAGLRFLLTGGERADPQCFRKVISGAAPRHFIHCYGPTETTTFAITHEITEVDERAGSIPLGRPISNTHIYILDAYGEPAPIGVVGEIYIGGAGVARGYLNRPELTAARFVEDRFSGEAGARLYRTGDLGRWLSDGTIAYLGRNDFQVKIRGFRIELGEIEARLSEHVGVRDVAVVAREDVAGDKRLVAYYAGDAAIGAEQLRGHLAARLPDYMVPAAYVHLDRLPLTPNGKLDRKALPAPEGTAFAAQAYEPPQGETEEVIARIWSELLGVERIGRHDNFFALGGHSLLLARMQVRLSQAGLSLSIPRIFANPTIASLVQNDGNSPTLDFESHLVELRSPAATEAKPLFIMSQGQGSVLYGAKLAARLPDGFPIYGLTSDGQRRDHLRTVEDIAACFVAIIKQIQPTGPYRLAGWSFGGKLAYEVARQLLSAHDDVQFVGLIDTYYRRATWISDEVADRLLSSLSPQSRETTRQLMHADGVYEGEYVPIKICLFVAQEAPNEDPHRGWKEVLPEEQIVTIQIPGAHDDVMSDGNIEVLVQSLSEQLLKYDETGQIG
ncbi:non-ribosomal peptide synthetase, partial [Bradyrhizobium sp.]|uniref:non-ribosomal peptide synthetase n=1 Tax=Bradyrhizobium sp. TaxID=376 RepID=UPI00391CF68B